MRSGAMAMTPCTRVTDLLAVTPRVTRAPACLPACLVPLLWQGTSRAKLPLHPELPPLNPHWPAQPHPAAPSPSTASPACPQRPQILGSPDKPAGGRVGWGAGVCSTRPALWQRRLGSHAAAGPAGKQANPISSGSAAVAPGLGAGLPSMALPTHLDGGEELLIRGRAAQVQLLSLH